MKELIHEVVADEANYVYFNITGVPRKGDEKLKPKDGKDWNSMMPSFHKAMEFWVVVKGGYSAWINGEKIELSVGDILFVNSYKTHYYTQMPNSSKIVLVFDQNFLKNVIGEGKSFPTIIRNEELFTEYVRVANSVHDGWNDLSVEKRIGFTYRMLGLVAQYVQAISNSDDRKTDSFAKKIVEYLFVHYDEDVNIKTLASEFGYTEGYFSELFNKVMGMNLREYVNRLRITVADNIKNENPNVSLREISERVGYNSWVTFHRAYNKYSKYKEKS